MSGSTNGSNGRKDVAALDLALDLGQESVEGGKVRLVRAISRSTSTREQANDPSSTISDNGARVARITELVVLGHLGVVSKHDILERIPRDTIFGVAAGDRLKAVNTPERSLSRTTFLDGEEGLDTVHVQVWWAAEIVLGHEALELEEHVFGNVVVAAVVDLGEHVLDPIRDLLVSSCYEKGERR